MLISPKAVHLDYEHNLLDLDLNHFHTSLYYFEIVTPNFMLIMRSKQGMISQTWERHILKQNNIYL